MTRPTHEQATRFVHNAIDVASDNTAVVGAVAAAAVGMCRAPRR